MRSPMDVHRGARILRGKARRLGLIHQGDVRPSQSRNDIGKLAGCIMQFPFEFRAYLADH
jgi:hypothetical protein